MKNQKQRLYCRGEKKRIQICEKFNIIPLAHYKLLNGIKIKSDAEDSLTDEYYIFKAINKNNENEIYYIFCGNHVAKSFARIANIQLPPLFNPLISTRRNTYSSSGSETEHKKKNKLNWNTERKQLYDIVQLILLSFGGEINPNSALFNIKMELENVKYIHMYPKRQIRSVNTVLKNLGKTFEEILENLSKQNKIKDFKYEEIRQYMIRNNIDERLKKK